jgi:hypothetical protein
MENLRRFENSNKDAEENREQRANILLRFLSIAKNIESFGDQSFETIFSDEEHKREFIENLSIEGFLQLLNGLNGILRNKKKEDWVMDGETVVLSGEFSGEAYIPPRQEDKIDLLEEVLLSAKTMSQEGMDLKDIALLVSSSVNAIHSYLDANGRTSRMIYLLLTKEFNAGTKEELKIVLSKEGSDKIDINPGLIQIEINELIKNDVGIDNLEINPKRIKNLFNLSLIKEIEFNNEISEQDKKLFLEIYKTDGRYLFWSVFEFFQNNSGLKINDFIQKFSNRSVILVDELVKNLNQEQFSQILQNYRNLKKKYVEKLIDSIANPDVEEYQIDEYGQKISLKNYFENRINEEQEEKIEKEREQKEAEQQGKKRIEEENALKTRFENGEGDYKFFESSEIESIQELEHSISEMIEIKKQEYSEEQKIDILKKALFDLAGKITNKVSISQEQINVYIENKKVEIIDFFSQFQTILEIVNFIEKSGDFAYKIHTSSDYEIPFAGQDYLNRPENVSRFLDDLFSQSIYYISPNGLTLRLKLFEIKSETVANVIQPIMEQIFFSNKMVDYTNKKVVEIANLSPKQDQFVFEISSPEFIQKLPKQENADQLVKSGIGTISDKNKEVIYVNKPKGSTVHSGWQIVGIKNLKE